MVCGSTLRERVVGLVISLADGAFFADSNSKIAELEDVKHQERTTGKLWWRRYPLIGRLGGRQDCFSARFQGNITPAIGKGFTGQFDCWAGTGKLVVDATCETSGGYEQEVFDTDGLFEAIVARQEFWDFSTSFSTVEQVWPQIAEKGFSQCRTPYIDLFRDNRCRTAPGQAGEGLAA
jgi:hypothetical protein